MLCVVSVLVWCVVILMVLVLFYIVVLFENSGFLVFWVMCVVSKVGSVCDEIIVGLFVCCLMIVFVSFINIGFFYV